MRSLNTLRLISTSHQLSHACDARSHDPGNSQCSYSDSDLVILILVFNKRISYV
jgi:hypothetical protein